jgi:hypothetical protein
MDKLKKSNKFDKNTFNNRFCWLNDIMGPTLSKIFLVLLILFILVMIGLYADINDKSSASVLITCFLITILSLGLFFSFYTTLKTIYYNNKLLLLIIFICIMIYLFNTMSNSDLKTSASYLFPFIFLIGLGLLYFNIYHTIDYKDLVTKYSYTNSEYLKSKHISSIIIYICLCVFLFILYNSNIGKYAMDSYNELFGTRLKINLGVIIMFIVLTLIVGFIFLIMTLFDENELPKELNILFNKSVILYSSGFILFIIMLVWIINTLLEYSNTGRGITNFLINTFFIVIILGIFFRLLTSTEIYIKSPLLRLICNSIFYIPCLFYALIEGLYNLLLKLYGFTKMMPGIPGIPGMPGMPGIPGMPGATQKEQADNYLWLFFLVLILYFIYYVAYPYFTYQNETQDGLLLVNKPISINNKTTLASYQTLHGTEKFDYQYGISFWLYLDSENPSVNLASNKYTSVIHYGDKFHLVYNVKLNTMRLITKNNGNSKNVLDEDGNTILFEKPNILLQKWNNIIINYNSGALDIFYNGLLEKSKLQIVPFMEYDSLVVGSEKGIFGRICNVNYFKTPLTSSQIYNLYNSLKKKTPPIVSDIDKTVMDISAYTIKPVSSFIITDPNYDINLPSGDDLNEAEDINKKIDPKNVADFNPDYLSLKWYFKANKDDQNV